MAKIAMSSMELFDPNGVGIKGTLFGLPYDTDEAAVVVIPVPWDVTVSYGGGTAEAPAAVVEASSQIDYARPDMTDAWKLPIAMSEIPKVWHARGKALRKRVRQYINWLEKGSPKVEALGMHSILHEVNEQCALLMQYIEQETRYWHSRGKKTLLLGGDHSTPLGHIRAYAKAHESFGILQIDAHADLRMAYEGFTHSHASIMRNVLDIEAVEQLVQVGVRDFCEEELSLIQSHKTRIQTFFDQDLKEAAYRGVTWAAQCDKIMDSLPEKVYVSFDIDGLDPKLCPHTGTPVPGGFELEQVMYLIKKMVDSGRTLIGADLCEVVPGENEWDANVGARVLYQLALLILSFKC